MDPLDSSLKWKEKLRLHGWLTASENPTLLIDNYPDTIEGAITIQEAANNNTVHDTEDSKFTRTETDGGLLGPAVLWGILSECRVGSAYGQPNEPEHPDSSTMKLSFKQEPGQILFDNVGECPAILWGILLPDISPTTTINGSRSEVLDTNATTINESRSEVLDTNATTINESRSKVLDTNATTINESRSKVLNTNAIIKIWIAAGYECPLPMEESLSPAISDFELVDEEFTQSPSGPFIVKESPGRGQGIFSARNVGKGERILMEKPFFVVSKEYNQQTVLDAFEHMSLSRRKQYMQLTCPDRWDDIHMTDVMRIFEANCFNIGNRAAMFLTATRFNHSCVPNTYYSWNENRSEIVFQVMIDISENEEMTICYGNPFRTFLQRRHELRIYSFRCHCPACQIETPFGQASQSRRLTMRDLEEQIIMFQSMLNEALLCYGLRDPLTVILRLIQLIKEEGLHGELMTPYRDAADYLKGRGNIEEALKFAHLELEEEVVCLGNDSDVVHKTVEYIKKLEVELKT